MVIMAISIIIVIIIISSPSPVARTPFLKIFELIIKESGDEGSDTLPLTLPSTPLPLPTHTHTLALLTRFQHPAVKVRSPL